ncbi:MAG: TIGR04282 family arsenosugar biosynthesis glycosyltransferase [Pseudomonadota bacterium]
MPHGKPECPCSYGAACILFFVRYPVAGMVKTRLAKSIGDDAAARLYSSFVEQLLGGLRHLAHETGATLRIVYDGASVDFAFSQKSLSYTQLSKQSFLQNWLGPYSYVPQSGGDIGERMESAMSQAFADGFERVLLLGSDIPDFPMEHVEMALTALHSSPMTINPTEDGGYCLIGLTRQSFLLLSPILFHDMPWSTEDVFSQTMQRVNNILLQSSFSSPHILPAWYDIDTIEDLEKLQKD